MLVLVSIVHIYIFKKIQYFLSRQEEACRDKFDGGKTCALLACVEILTPHSVTHLRIFGKCHLLTPRSVSLRAV